MKVQFDNKLRLNKDNKRKLNIINMIIKEYLDQGYILTLRQLYYQLVSRDIIQNETKEYAKIGNLLKKGRMAGVVDWDAIEDRLRVPKIPYYVNGVADALEDIINQYRLDRLKDQDVYVEVWSEKDALSGILYRVTSKYHVRLVINRGYGSITALYDAYKRFVEQIDCGLETHLLYFGDHDASGLDMVRDITERMSVFFAKYLSKIEIENTFKVHHLGLTTAQVELYKPPPNPAKESDPRFKWYQKKYGNTSWEVDALDPKTLDNLLSTSIEKYVDMDKYYSVVDAEDKEKEELRIIKDNYTNN